MIEKVNQTHKMLQPPSACRGFGRVHFLMFAVLSVVLFGVFFLLPGSVTVQLNSEQNSQTISEKPADVVAPPDSPWSDAQLAKQRREAQEVLSQILSIQTKLEAKKVELWAQSAFSQAMDTAASGDVQYRQRNFSQAQNNYKDALNQFDLTLECMADHINYFVY